jgi:excisionase family DNA binding protein
MLTVKQAAATLGVSPRRVLQYISEGRLEARKHGRDWDISPLAVSRFARRGPGRPRDMTLDRIPARRLMIDMSKEQTR